MLKRRYPITLQFSLPRYFRVDIVLSYDKRTLSKPRQTRGHMEYELITVEATSYEVAEMQDLASQARDYAKLARSGNTNRAYASDWNDFAYWCASKRLNSMPAMPHTVAVYLADRAGNEWIDQKGKRQTPLKVASLQRRLTAISQAHCLAKIPFDRRHPDILQVWKGIRNKNGTAQVCKDPILLEDLREMISAVPIEKAGRPHLLGLRDRALLLIGFVGAFRRSELVSLHHADVKFSRDGIVVNLRKSKTDQEGRGREIAIPYGSNPLTCPVRTLQDWLTASKIEEGPLFRAINRHGQIKSSPLTSHAIALIIKRNDHIGDRKDSFSGHSLRAGFATTAAIAGVPEHVIMKQTGHKKTDTIKRYIRLGNMWKENAATKIGL